MSSSEVDDEDGGDSSDEDYMPHQRPKRMYKRSKEQELKQDVPEKKSKKTSSRGINVLPKGRTEDTKYYQHFKVCEVADVAKI